MLQNLTLAQYIFPKALTPSMVRPQPHGKWPTNSAATTTAAAAATTTTANNNNNNNTSITAAAAAVTSTIPWRHCLLDWSHIAYMYAAVH